MIATHFRFFLVAFVMFFALNTYAQITAEDASFYTQTQYTSSANETVYVFCDPMGLGVGSLKASSPDGTSGWTFAWLQWDKQTGNFTPIATETNRATSLAEKLSDGRYRVEVSKSGEGSFDFTAWVLNRKTNELTPSLSLKNSNCVGNFFSVSFTCLSYTDVDEITTEKQVPEDITIEMFRNGKVFQTLPVIAYKGEEKSFFDGEAFEGTQQYVAKVKSFCGEEYVSPALEQQTHVVKAEFSVNPVKGEAPLHVEFTNSSVNGQIYEWHLYQDYNRISEEANALEDSLLTDGILSTSNKDLLEFTYAHSGEYLVKLRAKSDWGGTIGTCVHEIRIESPIVADTSLVQVPNVFTPNGDGRNDVWRVKSQSLKSFHAIVFNRWGRRVYEWRNPNEGWDGRVNGKMASPGTYFYVITAVGLEQDAKIHTKKGSVMLIRK